MKFILPKARDEHPRGLESVIVVRTGRHPHRAVRALQRRWVATILLSNEKVQRNMGKSRYVMQSPVDKRERLDWIAVGGDLASEAFSGVATFSLVERLPPYLPLMHSKAELTDPLSKKCVWVVLRK